MSLRFAMVADTHVAGGPSASLAARLERVARVYAAIGRLAPDFVLHCGDITDTGLPGEYELYQLAVPATLRGRIRHVPGNHDVRWDPTAKGLYRAHFGAAPYSFDAGGVHFTGFDPTQPLLDPIAGHDVRGIIAGHVHRETATRLGRLTQVTLRAVREDPVFYWADLEDGPALAVSRVTVAGDGTQARSPVATVPLSGRRPPPVATGAAWRAGLSVAAGAAAGAAGLPRPQWRLRLTGSVQGGIATAGRVIVAASTAGDVAAVRVAADPGNRRISWLWRVRLGPGYLRPGVASSAGTLFVPSADQ